MRVSDSGGRLTTPTGVGIPAGKKAQVALVLDATASKLKAGGVDIDATGILTGFTDGDIVPASVR